MALTGSALDIVGRQAASERIAAHLRTAILGGEIKPGARLRQEDIADRLGTSRIPVREALRILAAEGLTELEANKGARVLLLDAREVDLMYQMRERLEPLALAESMPRLTAADLVRLDDIQARIERWKGVAAFIDLDREFHLLTYSRCDMEPLASTVTRLWNSTQHYRRQFMNLIGPEDRWVVNAEHRLLLEALRRCDTVDAGLCLQSHIRRTRVKLAQHPEIFDDGCPA
jgi:DNA-binding GntR family transcriptional regulator